MRSAIERPATAGSTLLAKSEIGRTFTRKIEEASSPKDLKKIAEKVLPELEKFLESPEEKKLRRMRTGSLVALIGFGIAIGFLLAAIFDDPELIRIAAGGLITLCVGLAIVINGYFFTVPSGEQLEQTRTSADAPPELHKNTNELLMPPTAQSHFGSVTENTTRTLDEKIPVAKKTSE